MAYATFRVQAINSYATRFKKMIKRPRLHWFRMLLVVRGSVLREILPQLVMTAVFAIFVTDMHGTLFRWKVPLNFVPFSLVGLTVAIFLGFRNSTSYARYSEARNLWGALLNDSRSLMRQAVSLCADTSTVPLFAHRLIAFAHALRHQLRGTDPTEDFQRILSSADCQQLAAARFKPAVILNMLGQWLGERHRDGTLSPPLIQAMETPLCGLSNVLGGCERIANTPIPFPYSVILHRTIYLYCTLLPFGLVDSVGFMTPIVVTFIAYTFFALEELSAQIEEPFGSDPNDLPLGALSIGIEATLRETLGEPVVTAPAPYNGYIQT